jgi:hypothetical protein
MTHQTKPLSIDMSINDPCVYTLPPNFFVQMFNLFSYFLPQTHLKMMDLWLDISDLSNDQCLCNTSLKSILSQVFFSNNADTNENIFSIDERRWVMSLYVV